MSVKEDVTKTFGDDIILTGNAIVDKKSVIIPVSPALDIVLNGGIPEGSFVVLTGQPKCGKDLAITETVYTPSGPIEMGEIKIGDIICNANGGTSKVIGVYPQGKKDVYKVTFNDGTTSLCGLEHNWTVSRNNRKSKYFTTTLQEIIQEGLYYSDRPKWKIPLTKPVYFKQKNKLPIDPYILGCLIGDGGLTQKTPRLTTADQFIAQKFQRFCQNRGLS